MPGHVFWADSISLSDGAVVDAARLASHAQVTDSYLLALARTYKGRLATFDRRLAVDAVEGGRYSLALI